MWSTAALLTSKISPCATCNSVVSAIVLIIDSNFVLLEAYYDILLVFRTLRNNGAFEPVRKREPDEVSSNNVAVRLRHADAQWDQRFIDGGYHPSVAFTITGLEHVVDVTLEFTVF